MKVYRFERNGIGPFTGGTMWSANKNQASRRKQARAKHVRNIRQRKYSHWHDAHNKAVREGYVFAAASKNELKAYFTYQLQDLFKSGFRIKAYEVPENEIMHLGNGEVAFPVQYHRLRTKKNVDRARYSYLQKK